MTQRSPLRKDLSSLDSTFDQVDYVMSSIKKPLGEAKISRVTMMGHSIDSVDLNASVA